MPRIVYDQPQQTSPGLAIADLATGLLGGYIEGQAQSEQRDQAQRDAAFGNPYERRRRRVMLAALPQDLRQSPNARTYEELIMSGGDLNSVLRVHQQLDTDPVYGDSKTRAAREADIKTAMAGKLIEDGDVATPEAIRKGELTLGKLLQDAQVRKRTLADRKTEKDEKSTAAREMAAALDLPQQLPMPGGVAGPGRLADYAAMGPEGVRAVAANQRAIADDERYAAKDAENASRAEERLNLDERRVEAYVKSVQAKGAPATDEDIDGLAEAIQQSNPGIPLTQARGIAKGRLQYKSPIQIPTETGAQKGQREVVRTKLQDLRSIRRSLLGPNGSTVGKRLSEQLGIPLIDNPTVPVAATVDREAVAAALDAQIGELESKLEAGVLGTPSPATPATSSDQVQRYQSKLDAVSGW